MVKLIGCSGGALAAINVALENPELVRCAVADSFGGLKADAETTEQIRVGRNLAKQNAEFRSMLAAMHGEDWESIVDADTEAVVTHAKTIGSFLHKPIEDLKTKLLLTGSAEDEMFPKGHYEKLFADICGRTGMARSLICEHGCHPAMMAIWKNSFHYAKSSLRKRMEQSEIFQSDCQIQNMKLHTESET